MATITLGGNTTHTVGELPGIGTKAPDFKLTKSDLSDTELADFKGKKLLLNIFPSVDTRVCATSIRHFNKTASELANTTVLCISKDLPFAQARFCGAEGLDNVVMLSDFRTGDFGKDYGLEMIEGAFAGLHSRVVMVLDAEGTVLYAQQVPEIGQEPNYDAALKTLQE